MSDQDRSARPFKKQEFDGGTSEQKALRALAWMASQYLSRGKGTLDSLAMSAGDPTLEVLAQHGLVTLDGSAFRFAEWTEAGRTLLKRLD